jgi:hypothetical protein
VSMTRAVESAAMLELKDWKRGISYNQGKLIEEQNSVNLTCMGPET